MQNILHLLKRRKKLPKYLFLTNLKLVDLEDEGLAIEQFRFPEYGKTEI